MFARKLAATLLVFSFLRLAVGSDLPSNLGLGLRNLVSVYQTDRTNFAAKVQQSKSIQVDSANLITVNIHLDGSRPASEVENDLRSLGLTVLLTDPSWRDGVISARMPIEQATAVASLSGVRSVLLAPHPIFHAGAVTAESSVVDRAQQVNAKNVFSANGILGRGISVGIVSDSFNADQSATPAAAGVASGDLPGAGNPDGYTQPVVVINDDFAPGGGQTDEGRAMAEIVHDIAPAAKLAFSTVQETQAIMAYSIRNLRANSAATCDIIVDDVFFPDEPFFSDGQLAQAVEDVVNGTALPGKKVLYFSAAGNEANQGYSSDLRLLSPAQGLSANRAASGTQVQLDFSTVPDALYAGGFHNFSTNTIPAIAMPISSTDYALLDFQWDDPFDAKAVTTDYNVLVFDSTGTFQPALSGTDDNVSTDEPLELAAIPSGQIYYLVISLATSSPPTATHLRFISPSAPISSPYISYEAVSMAGHATAASANAVAAYNYNTTPTRDPNFNPQQVTPPPEPYRPGVEPFTSNGGALLFYFDAKGKRLAMPEVRFKPDMAAADGVDTTFFGADSDNDNFPNFFGTSAAAPTAAGIAALMLEAAGGPQKLSATQVRARLQATAIPHDLDPFVCNAVATHGSATVRVQAHGNDSNDSATDPNFFNVRFDGASGESLDRLTIDLTDAGLIFDPDPATGFPFTYSSASGNVVAVATFSPDFHKLSIDFGGSFLAGDSVSFGVDRDYEATNAGGNSADLLAGATMSAQIDGGIQLLASFANVIGNGFTFVDGYGLVDAQAAVGTIIGKLPQKLSAAGNLSTRASVGNNDDVLIGGFIVQGPASKRVVLRALGPSLEAHGVPVTGTLSDPMLELHDSNGLIIAANDNWRDDPAQTSQIQAAGLAPSNLHESAIAITLAPSSYTAVVRGENGTTGIGLVEIYDLDQLTNNSQLANISSRGRIEPDDGVMIGGFILEGDSSNIILRALGPSLAGAGVGNVLGDPTLELRDAEGSLIATNDNWQQDSSQATQIQAAGLAPTDPLESAIATTLPAGAYTTVVRGANNSDGIGLVEMYHLN